MAIAAHDFVSTSPTNTFATLNPLVVSNSALSDGNLGIVTPTAVTNNVLSTIQFPNEGKWFFEILYISYEHHNSGIINKSTNTTYTVYQNGFYTNSANPSTLSANSYSTSSNSVIGLLINFENVQATVTIYINGTSVGGPFNIDAGEYFSVFNDGASATGGTQIVNFGQDHLFGGATLPTGAGSNTPDNGIGTFAFSVPTGAKALCTANLPDPDIDPAVDDLPEDNFKAVTWTGDGSNPRDISIGFNPDFVWIKNRTGTANSHATFDSVRGFGKKHLWTDLTAGETANEFGHVSGVSNNNITVTAGASDDTYVNNSGTTYVGWCFRAGGAPSGSTSTTGSAKRINTSGTQDDTSCDALATAASATITPTAMSVNTKAGFSIVKYVSPNPAISNPSVPHGLDKAPDFVIIKRTSSACNWVVKHVGYNSNANNTLRLDTTDDIYVDAYNWGGNQVTNSVVPLGNYSNSDTNKPGETNIMYCWHSVAGYSAFGSYTGTNSAADGPFIYTGFKPAFVMIKGIQIDVNYPDYYSWIMFDNQRPEYNSSNTLPLYANQAKVEGQRGGSTVSFGEGVDFLSNGFKIRNVWGEINYTFTYIYMAFAEMPQKYAATNAR